MKIVENNSIAAKIVKEFLEKFEIKNYAKHVIKNTVLEISKIDHEIYFGHSNGDDRILSPTLGRNRSKSYKN